MASNFERPFTCTSSACFATPYSTLKSIRYELISNGERKREREREEERERERKKKEIERERERERERAGMPAFSKPNLKIWLVFFCFSFSGQKFVDENGDNDKKS